MHGISWRLSSALALVLGMALATPAGAAMPDPWITTKTKLATGLDGRQCHNTLGRPRACDVPPVSPPLAKGMRRWGSGAWCACPTRDLGNSTGRGATGSLVIPGIHNSMIFMANKECPYKSSWIL